jgi:methionine-rich copper-binding protein CopC
MKIRTGILIGLVPLLVLCQERLVRAHAFPERSDPKVGSAVAASPAKVRIWFDGELEPLFSRIRVVDDQGRRMDRENGNVSPADGTLLEADLTPLSPGTYRVVWEVIARDGHPTEGEFTFTVQGDR